MVVSYRRLDLLQACVDSLLQYTDYPFRITVVDNGSGHPVAHYLDRLQRHGIRVIRNTTNAGYARACNQGMAAGRGRFIVLLNNDVQATPGWLSPLVRCMESDPRIAVAGPRLVTPDGFLVGIPVTGTDRAPRQPGLWKQEALYALPDRPVDSLTVSGAAYMIRREHLLRIGPMDEGYFLYFEDADYSLRARESGFRVVYCPMSRLIHRVSATGRDEPDRGRRYAESARRFASKWQHRW